MRIKRFYQAFVIEIAVFVSGALVMIYEIIGSRILSPYVGSSTYTWTSLIGVVLGSLSIGYWIGGKKADSAPDQRVLAAAMFIAGALVAGTVLLKEPVLELISGSAIILEIKTLIAALVLFAPAGVLLGFVPPYAVKLRNESLNETGRTVGRLYALSTVGSILGTFAAGFVLIPFVGSARTLYGIAGSLLLLSVLLAPFRASRTNITVLVLLFVGIVVQESRSSLLAARFAYYDIDTRYNRVQVFETTERSSGRRMRAMAIDPYIFQSSIYTDNGLPATKYHRFYHLVRHYNPGFRHVLMIGGAGYSFPKEFLGRYKDRKIDVVELDPQMTVLAERFFMLRDDPRLKIRHLDGRLFLNRARAGSYDAILVDAFTSLFSIPFQLTTIEAVLEMHRTLSENGVVILNIGTAAEGDASLFLRAEEMTYRSVFPHVDLFQVDRSKPPDEVQNIILVASKKNVRRSLRGSDPQIDSMLKNYVSLEKTGATSILTDDLAPVEYYSSISQRRFVAKMLAGD